MPDVGTNKLFENDKVTVWELKLEPGEKSGVHTHAHDYFIHVIEAAELRAFEADGAIIGDFNYPVGETIYVEIDGEDAVFDGNRASATHEVQNIDNTRYRELLVEMK